MSLLDKRHHYKPFSYPWAFEAYHVAQKMHWLPDEVSLQEDIDDWNKKLSMAEKNLLTQLFRFFTQADADIAAGYHERYIPAFPHPELRMMMGAFATAEANHIHAYSLLLDTIGMPETEYQAFAEFDEMRAKHDYLFEERSKFNSLKRLALDLVKFSAFGEGLQLFSTFALLLSFKERNMMKGMSTIIEWSINDESLHVESMIKVFRTLVEENPSLWTKALKDEIYRTADEMVRLEDAFIDLAFAECGDLPNCSAAETKQYIRYIADRRLLQLGLKTRFGVKDQPYEWLEWMLNAKTHTNFFEGRETGYSKSGITGWERAYDRIRQEARLTSSVPESSTSRFVMFTKKGCPYCSLLKHSLTNRGISFDEIDLSDDALRNEFYKCSGTSSVPQLYHTSSLCSATSPSGKRLGGWSDLSNSLETLGDLLK